MKVDQGEMNSTPHKGEHQPLNPCITPFLVSSTSISDREMLVFHLACHSMSRHHFHGTHDCFCAFRRTSNSIWASRRVAQHHLGITRHAQKELVQISSFLMFFGKVVIWRMGPAPPGWAQHRDAGIQEGAPPPLRAQAVARGNLVYLQAA